MSALSNMHLPPLPEGSVPLEAVVLVKFLSAEGTVRYGELSTPSLTTVEALGMITTAQDTMRARLMTATARGNE